MPRSFGKHLKQFALSVDIIEESTFNRIESLLKKYFKDKLNCSFFEILVPCMVNGQPGLYMWSTSAKKKVSNSIKKADGSYNGQTSFAYDIKKPLWIVPEEKKECLDGTEMYLDLWSGQTGIPVYWHYSQDPIKTSIIFPYAKDNDAINCILNIESKEYLKICGQAKEEIKIIAEAIGILLELSEYNSGREENTIKAIDELSNREKHAFKLEKPKVFIASSGNAKNDVMDLLLKIARSFSTQVEIVYWKDIEKSGNINIQIINAIRESSFGICYFSEPKAKNGKGFFDNPNVLFEAGMLHSLCCEPESVKAWLPVREKSKEKPFDIAAERMLVIERQKNGALNKVKFQEGLRKKIKAMIDSLL